MSFHTMHRTSETRSDVRARGVGDGRPLLEEYPGYEVSPKLVSTADAAGHIGGARLASHLRGFSRQRRLEPAIVNLNDHLLETMESLRGLLGDTISLALSLAGDLWTVRANPIKIEIALLNLALNTRDAMPNGGTLIIETRNVDVITNEASDEIGLTPGEYVHLSISDTGCGDAQEVLDRFEPFFTTKPVGRDTGRGLGCISEFIRQSGGNATIYTEPGRGTTVNLYLPRSNEARESSDAPVTAAEIDNKISYSVNRSLLSLSRDSPLRHKYLRKRWQVCLRLRCPLRRRRHARAQEFQWAAASPPAGAREERTCEPRGGPIRRFNSIGSSSAAGGPLTRCR